ncbi:hypothetical protein PQX77_012226 [Marasmius sp. AFHP31]|nr:hypothetical protein PQX77_012226 [Marasmius sp. AFHP31]
MGVIWSLWRRRKNQTSVDSESRSLNDGDTHITPYHPPGAIEIVENRGRLWKNRGLLNGANVLNLSTPGGTSIENRKSEKPQEDTPQTERSRETIGARQSGRVTCQTTEPPGGGIFRHTNSGWRLAFQRAASQPSETGSRSVFEIPPTYSEAG